MPATEYLILVNQDNEAIGQAEKQIVHAENLLHRAFSVFLLREDYSEVLLQQRALHKYHSPGLWTNACCSHPHPSESVIKAATRRLQEELGVHSDLKDIGWFHYNAHFENGLSENEIDHVLIGTISLETKIYPNADEIAAYRWISLASLEEELNLHPEQFTAWFQQAWLSAKQYLFPPTDAEVLVL